MKKLNLAIQIQVQELNDNIKYAGGKSFIIPMFIAKKDCSVESIDFYFMQVAEYLIKKLKIKKPKIRKYDPS